MTYADGGKYAGEWKNNKFEGQGTKTLADGRKYIGEWKNDKIDGRGTTYKKDGSIDADGYWSNNEFLGSK